MKLEKKNNDASALKDAVRNPVIISAVSGVLALGVAATVYTTQRIRHNKMVKPKVETVTQEGKIYRSYKDPYFDDNDLGYC